MSQERLAALCGYKSKSDISNIENGLSNPEFATIQKIAAALGLTVSLDLLPPSTQSPSKPKS
jgi:transcriptional regulator with XRE-family HTH domain